MGLLRWGTTSAAMIALVGCSHGSNLYSPQDARRAFAKEGFALVSASQDGRSLLPRGSEPFFSVTVYRTIADATHAYRLMHRKGTPRTLDLRSRNVLTITDVDRSQREKARLRRAMDHLR